MAFHATCRVVLCRCGAHAADTASLSMAHAVVMIAADAVRCGSDEPVRAPPPGRASDGNAIRRVAACGILPKGPSRAADDTRGELSIRLVATISASMTAAG
jgi:hypothetical protein